MLALLVIVTLPAATAARLSHPPGRRAQHRRTRATVLIRRTSYGIPHIQATTYAGAGEGYGYAFAQDDICTMAEDYVTVDAQRSRYFGPAGSYEQRGNGVTVANLDSDFFFQQIIDSGAINRLLARPLRLEAALIERGGHLPAGVSIGLVAVAADRP